MANSYRTIIVLFSLLNVFQGRTPLLLAVEKHLTECVEVLAVNGADVNASTRVFKMTPLILAAERGYTDIVQILLNHNALMNQTDLRGENIHR